MNTNVDFYKELFDKLLVDLIQNRDIPNHYCLLKDAISRLALIDDNVKSLKEYVRLCDYMENQITKMQNIDREVNK